MDRIAEILAALADPASLTDDQVAEYETELLTIFDQIRTGAYEGVDRTDTATLRSIADAVQALRGVAAERLTAAETLAAEIEAIAAELAVEAPEADPAPDPSGDDADPVAAVDGETVTPDDADVTAPAEPLPVAAAAAPPAAAPSVTRVAARSTAPAPRPTEPAAPNHSFTMGRETVTKAEALARMGDALDSGAVFSERARLNVQFPEELQLTDGSNTDRINRIRQERRNPANWGNDAPITAAMWCAPAEVIYDYPVTAEADRPFRDALPSAQLTRGKVQVPGAIKLSDVDIAGTDAAVSVWTTTQADAGTDKPVALLPCPSFTTYQTHAVTKRYRFTNMDEMAYGEHIANYDALVDAAHARMAEGKLLDLVKAAVDNSVTEAASFGASRDLIEAIKRAAAQIHSRQRSSGMLRVVLPEWALVHGESDLVRALQSDPGFLTDAKRIFAEALADTGVNVSTYRDTPSSGTSQVLATQSGQLQLNAMPTVVQWGIWDEGHFLFLDRGRKDFGVVRDTTMNNDNLAEIFYETFEGVAKVGVESLWVSQSVCHDGTSGAGVDVNVCLGS